MKKRKFNFKTLRYFLKTMKLQMYSKFMFYIRMFKFIFILCFPFMENVRKEKNMHFYFYI